MTDLVLVRHGETVWHAENRYAGVSDVDLTPRGVEQAQLLAGWAATAGLTEIWASPLSRARRTAAICADATSLPLELDERLRELDFGAGEGLTAEEMDSRLAGARAAFRRDPVAHHLPGGEDPVSATARFIRCLGDIADGPARGGRVLVIAHTTVIRLALCSFLGVPLGEYRRLFPTLGNCALTQLRLDAGRASLLQFNAPIESRLL